MEYINQGQAAKVSHQERLIALKAEQVEVLLILNNLKLSTIGQFTRWNILQAEALQAEREQSKKEAEERERQALEKYKTIEHQADLDKQESDPLKITNEGLKVYYDVLLERE